MSGIACCQGPAPFPHSSTVIENNFWSPLGKSDSQIESIHQEKERCDWEWGGGGVHPMRRDDVTDVTCHVALVAASRRMTW